MAGKKKSTQRPAPAVRSIVRNVVREPPNVQQEGEVEPRGPPEAEPEGAATCQPASARIVSPDPNPMSTGPLDYLVTFNQTISSDGAATVINQPQETRASAATPTGSPLVRTSGPAASLTPASDGRGQTSAPASTISGTSGSVPAHSGRWLALHQETIRDTTLAMDAIRRMAGRDIGGAGTFPAEQEKPLAIDPMAGDAAVDKRGESQAGGAAMEQYAVQAAAAAAIREYAERMAAPVLAVNGAASSGSQRPLVQAAIGNGSPGGVGRFGSRCDWEMNNPLVRQPPQQQAAAATIPKSAAAEKQKDKRRKKGRKRSRHGRGRSSDPSSGSSSSSSSSESDGARDEAAGKEKRPPQREHGA